MTGGRVIFGSGPGALASDAYMLGIDPMVQRDRQDEAIGVIRRLLSGERVSHEERLVHAARRARCRSCRCRKICRSSSRR